MHNPIKHVDITIDLETMSLKRSAAILHIGGYCLQTGQGISLRVDPKYYNGNVNFHKDLDTMEWWGKQSAEIRDYVFGGTLDLDKALLDFNTYISQQSTLLDRQAIRVWGNGSMFDNANLLHAYDVENLEPAWTYKGDLCYRTLKALYPGIECNAVNQRPHDAAFDAAWQGQHLKNILSFMGKYE